MKTSHDSIELTNLDPLTHNTFYVNRNARYLDCCGFGKMIVMHEVCS